MEETSNPMTIEQAIARYLENVRLARSKNTARTYANGMALFKAMLAAHRVQPEKTPLERLPEEAIAWFAEYLKIDAPTTERLYLTAAAGLYEYLAAEGWLEVNLPRIRLLIRQRARRPGVRLPQFPGNAIAQVIQSAALLPHAPAADEAESLRNFRDCAFLLTLADTGLRVHEACGLRRGDVEWFEGKAVIIGKGNREAVVRFSERSLRAIKDYLAARARLDGSSGRQLSSLPLFARHDLGAGKKVQPITTATGRNIVTQRVREFLGEDAVGTITPHSFRHYFVTTVLNATGNLKLAQELARHQNIAVTQRYAHLNDDELDKGYNDIFNQAKG